MSELRDRLEALANRGTRRGADDVLGAAQRDAQTIPSENGAGDFDDSEMEIIDDELPSSPSNREPGSVAVTAR